MSSKYQLSHDYMKNHKNCNISKTSHIRNCISNTRISQLSFNTRLDQLTLDAFTSLW